MRKRPAFVVQYGIVPCHSTRTLFVAFMISLACPHQPTSPAASPEEAETASPAAQRDLFVLVRTGTGSIGYINMK